ncbi:hypothetical protein [Desulfovibrio litoralis]|uniref:Uncharacterized protein n=1 Tax=Desulfovibrio litoralis DSM 11393 TaxID=1121455 RepID=A0A1M7TPA7_9BACT|nr:hypothetical protein [Desulfovibrio litoralis]SHN72581.1 hypothetical protein SAMN02745728_02324 [Desulfovibrio litoralis DSM 11393]
MRSIISILFFLQLTTFFTGYAFAANPAEDMNRIRRQQEQIQLQQEERMREQERFFLYKEYPQLGWGF